MILGLKTEFGIFVLKNTLGIAGTPYHFKKPNFIRKKAGYIELSYHLIVTSHNSVNISHFCKHSNT